VTAHRGEPIDSLSSGRGRVGKDELLVAGPAVLEIFKKSGALVVRRFAKGPRQAGTQEIR